MLVIVDEVEDMRGYVMEDVGGVEEMEGGRCGRFGGDWGEVQMGGKEIGGADGRGKAENFIISIFLVPQLHSYTEEEPCHPSQGTKHTIVFNGSAKVA